MDNESIKNILLALYTDSPVIRMYVDAIADGKPIPYTILMKSSESELNRQIVDKAHEKLNQLLLVKANNQNTELIDFLEELLDREFTLEPEEGKKYQVIMFKGDAVVDGSRQIVSDMHKIKMLKAYAESKGYEFSLAEWHD